MKQNTRVLCCLLSAVTLLGAVGCNKKTPNGPDSESTYRESDTERYEGTSDRETDAVTETIGNDDGLVIEPIDMEEIVYEMTQNQQKQGDGVTLTLPASETAVTGRSLTAYLNLTETLEDYNYFIVDWGDGTWSYNGPYSSNQRGEAYHTYKKAGTYEVKGCAINLAAGRRKGWTEAQTLVVSGEDYTPDNMIKGVLPVGGSVAGEEFDFANIADGDNTTKWQSQISASAANPNEYIGYLFDGAYTLDMLEIKFPTDVEGFPMNISVEYTTDHGKTWYMLPHYYYLLPNSEGIYSCTMSFPNPLGATLVLPMENICANGVRLKAVSYGRSGRYFGVSEMRVYGEKTTLFYSSYGDTYNADLTNMNTIFGLAKTEPYVVNTPFRAGLGIATGSLEWASWSSTQVIWTGDNLLYNNHVPALKGAVYGGDGWYYDEATGKYVVDESEYNGNPRNDGFIWATSGAPQHLDAQNHYTNNSTFIIAARDYILIEEPEKVEAFLASANGWGQVMLDKIRKAMDYMLVTLNGQSGLMTIYDPRNDGTVRGLSSNYWDSLNFFGYNSSYENIFFYEAVLAMVDIETYLGNTEEAAYYASIAERVKTRFNEYFWDPVKGRYITAVNVKGDVLDFGLTMVNFMAVAAGLASPEQAQLIYDWVDGKRIIEGDNSTGEDIYHFRVSARTNTVAVETIEEDGLHYWWYNGHGFNDVLPGHWGVYGQQMQNGGTIFYTSYYDVLGRTFLSGDLAIDRFNVIMEEFHKDSLRRDPRTQWGPYLVSINGEFPESGLVPASFLTHIIGALPDVEGLRIKPCLPSDMSYAGIREYHYNGRVYSIEINRDVTEPSMTEENGVYVVKLPADRTYHITRDNRIVEAKDNASAPAGAPSVTPAVHTVDADVISSNVVFTVDNNNGTGFTLTLNGEPVAQESYTRFLDRLTLKKDYIKYLPVGKHIFTITTSGGSTSFTLTVVREGVLFTDDEKIKKFDGEDVTFSVDFGSGLVERVTLNGEALPATAYTCTGTTLLISKNYLSTLEEGAYEILLYGAKNTCADCFVVIGMEPSEVYVVNFDSFTTTGGNFNWDTVDGRNGRGAYVVGNGTLFEIDNPSTPFDFVTGQTYSVTFDMKFDYTVDGTSSLQDLLMPIFFPRNTGGNADLLYLRYNATDGYYLHQCGYSSVATWTLQEDGWYRLHFEFVYQPNGESWRYLHIPVWMNTAFTVDNFLLVPVTQG